MAARFEIIPHTADVGIAVHADTVEELFAEAGRALFAIMVEAEGEEFTEEVRVEGDGHEDLLYTWLSELLFRFLAQAKVYTRIDVTSVTEREVVARLGGVRFDESRHRLRTEVKGVTLHQFEVRRDAAGRHARVIFDL